MVPFYFVSLNEGLFWLDETFGQGSAEVQSVSTLIVPEELYSETTHQLSSPWFQQTSAAYLTSIDSITVDNPSELKLIQTKMVVVHVVHLWTNDSNLIQAARLMPPFSSPSLDYTTANNASRLSWVVPLFPCLALVVAVVF